MRKIFRKLTACLIAISLPCFTLGLTKVDAKENVVFAKNMEQGKILKRYLEIQKEKHVSGLKKNIEKKFNEQGVLDAEIENFEKDDINRINQSDEIYIYTEYVAVDEKENTSHIMNLDAGLTSYAIACVDLKDDYSFTTIDYKRKFVVTNHYIVMQMDVVKDGNDRSRYFTSQTKYYHQQFLVTLDPKVSIDTSGKVSFSGMLSKDKYMHSMGSVLTYQYIWK